MKNIFLVAFLLLVAKASFPTNYNAGDTLYVVAINGLNLRASSDTDSEIIQKLDNGDTVLVLQTALKTDSIFGFNGDWVKIRSLSSNNEGYVFDAFISRFPVLKNFECWDKHDPSRRAQMPYYLFKEYIIRTFTPVGCDVEYINKEHDQGSGSIRIISLVNNEQLVIHTYHDTKAIELELVNPRISEIYYLVLNIMSNMNREEYEVNDYDLRKPNYGGRTGFCGIDFGSECLVQWFIKPNKKTSIFFHSPCC